MGDKIFCPFKWADPSEIKVEKMVCTCFVKPFTLIDPIHLITLFVDKLVYPISVYNIHPIFIM